MLYCLGKVFIPMNILVADNYRMGGVRKNIFFKVTTILIGNQFNSTL